MFPVITIPIFRIIWILVPEAPQVNGISIKNYRCETIFKNVSDRKLLQDKIISAVQKLRNQQKRVG
jgi:hypothetical protein